MMYPMTEDTRTTPPEFLEWLDEQLRESGYSDSEASRRAGLSHSAIYDIRSGVRPGIKKCEALAGLFGFPLEHVLRLAGHLPHKPADRAIDEQAAYLIGQFYEALPGLSPAAQRRIADQVLFLVNAHRAAAGLDVPATEVESQSVGEKTTTSAR